MLILLLDIQPQFWPNALRHSPATSRPPLSLYPSSPPASPKSSPLNAFASPS